MNEIEKALNLRIREYWARAHDAKNKNDNRFSNYDIGSVDFKNDDNRLPFKPTAEALDVIKDWREPMRQNNGIRF